MPFQTIPDYQRDIATNHPLYAPIELLEKYRPDYPYYYAKDSEKSVISKEVYYKGELKHVGPFTYYLQPAEVRIRILRFEEVYVPGSWFDSFSNYPNFVWTELELTGLYLYTKSIDVIEFIRNLLLRLVSKSNNGITLREYLKSWNTSFKRWLPYWETKLNCNMYLYLEIASVLGYIISNEYTPSLVADVVTTLTPTMINYPGSKDLFLTHVQSILARVWGPVAKPGKINFDDYLNDWSSWTTGGAASEIRMYSSTTRKKYRITKSAVPITVTKEQLYEHRFQPYRTILKSETGKVRIAYSAPTYFSLLEGYFLTKYKGILDKASDHDFISFNNVKKLQLYATSVDGFVEGEYVASSDIEKNDFIHDSYLDCLLLSYIIKDHIEPTDVELFLDLCQARMINWIFIPVKVESPVTKYSADKGSYLVGRGGIMSGRRTTTVLNNICNVVFSTMAADLLPLSIPDNKTNFFGGDDSWCLAYNYFSAWMRLLIQSAVLLTVSPLKSYVSRYNGEFFRVATKPNARFGYLTRCIHSVYSSNPVSKSEVDVLSRLRSFRSCTDMCERRGADGKYMKTLNNIFRNIVRAPKSVLAIPTVSGGFGLEDVDATKPIVKPGVPRFRETTGSYAVMTQWFDSLVFPYNTPEVRESYFKTLLQGVVDIDVRLTAKKAYKYNYNKWLKIFRVIETQLNIKTGGIPDSVKINYRLKNWLGPLSERVATNSLTESINLYNVMNQDLRRFQPFEVLNYALAADIITRVRTNTINEKLDLLVSTNAVIFKSSARSGYRGNVLIDLILSSEIPCNVTRSVSPDINGLVKVPPFMLLNHRRLSYKDCSYMYYHLTQSITKLVLSGIGRLNNW